MVWLKRLSLMGILTIMVLALTACGGGTVEEAPVVEAPAAEANTQYDEPAEEMKEPTKLNMAAIVTAGPENSWDAAFIEAYKRVQAESPYGLTLGDLDYTEGVWGDEAKVVLREYAKTGKYDIIWSNSAFSDEVSVLKDEFPEILWVTVGSGNRVLGDNSIWVFHHIHECGYLQGLLAGSLTETNTLGIVGTYPAEDVNDVIHAFINGAKEVNPDVETRITFIESWYDPPKALEAANAQIAAGVDQMYMMAEAFEPCIEQDIMCYAKYIDYNFAAPDNIISSALMFVDPHINYVIERWWTHMTTNEPYPEVEESVWFTMAEEACDVSPYHGLEGEIPQDVKDLVEDTRQKIMDGTFTVELDMSIYESD